MRPDGVVKILIDTSIRRDAITTKVGKTSRQIQWGPTIQTFEIEVEEPKAEPAVTETWKRQQITALPRIGELARNGRIQAYTYFGLELEDWLGSPGLVDGAGNALRGVDIQKVEPAFDPAYLFPMAFSRDSLMRAIVEFVDLIVRAPPSCWDVPEIKAALAKAPANQQRNFTNRGRLVELAQGLTTKQYKDAFHIWTAEVNQLDHFLTNDKKIVNFYRETSKAGPKAYPISPHMLLDILGVR